MQPSKEPLPYKTSTVVEVHSGDSISLAYPSFT